MNSMTQEAIFFLIGQFIVIAGGAITAYFNLLGKVGEVRERIIAIEVRDEMQSRKNAKILHSPHNPYGMDPLIDKYLDRCYEMTNDEWQEWLHRCEMVISNSTAPKEDRLIAAQLMCVCWHKLMMPPPFRKLVEKAANKSEDSIDKIKKI